MENHELGPGEVEISTIQLQDVSRLRGTAAKPRWLLDYHLGVALGAQIWQPSTKVAAEVMLLLRRGVSCISKYRRI
jgi:hypothetical protein